MIKKLLRNSKEPLVVILIGPSGTGKSTIANELVTTRDDFRIISSDDLRKTLSGSASCMEVSYMAFKQAHDTLRHRCKYDQSTIFDATSVKRKDRRKIFEMARCHNKYFKVVGVLVETDLNTCKERQHQRARQVPEDVIETQYNRYEASKENVLEEPFDELYLWDTKRDVVQEMEDFEGPPEPELEISDHLTCFEDQVIGSKVVKPTDFIREVNKAIKYTDFDSQRVKGQAYIPLQEAREFVSCGVGEKSDDPDHYVIRKYRGSPSMYLKREHAAINTEDLAIVVYTRAAYLSDPDVHQNKDELRRVKESDATHYLVAVLASASEEPSPLSPGRLVHNLAGGNKEAQEWSAKEIREKAEKSLQYYENWITLAD